MFLVVATVCVPVCTCVWLASRRQRPRTYVPNAVAVLRHTGQLPRQRIVGPHLSGATMRTRPLLLTDPRVAAAARQPCRSPVCPPTGSGVSYPASSSIACPSRLPRRPEGSPRKAGSTFDALRPAQGTPHSPHRSCGRQGSGARVGETRENGGRKGWQETQPRRMPAASTIKGFTDEDENQGLRTAAQSEENSS